MAILSYLLTWKLWHALQGQPRLDPLYRHVLRQAEGAKRGRFSIGWFLRGAIAVPLLWSCGSLIFSSRSASCPAGIPNCTVSVVTPTFWQFLPWMVLIGFIVVVGGFRLVFSGGIQGALAASRAVSTIAGEHESRRYDLLRLLPAGSLAADWAICSGLHQRRQRTRVQPRRRAASVMVWSGRWPLILGLMISLGLLLADDIAALLLALLAIPAILTFYHVERVQSVVLGNLVGILAARYMTRNRIDTQMVTVGSYLLLQVVSTIAALLAGLALAPISHRALNLQAVDAFIVTSLLIVLVFFGVREAAITAIWRYLTIYANPEPAPLETLSQPAP